MNVLEIDPVHLKEGRDQAFEKCLEDRHALARALRAARTRQALEESATYLKWNTILRPDTLDLACPRVVASYLIRTNRDDECHDFLRQYTLAICRSKGWLSDEEMTNERSSDSWNDTDLLHSPFVPTTVLLFATLIKLRMLRELQMFDEFDGAVSDSIGHRLPLELLELVRSHLHDNPILANTRTSRRSNYKDGIYHVKAQIDRLWWEVRQRCKYIWPYLVDHRVMLRPECCRHNHRMGHTGCTFCNLQDIARFNIEDAWKQSPGALAYIAEMAFKHDAACLVSDDDFIDLRATF
ncbi:uncharacterized protein LDX57_007013 [Aspergillus melleus]|uniref:uncharacterized protein n=1 Tax=Aspergillus melleus TaxID=138277 RepID=UPI001E8DA946|nr:uncharacterized protein LDX57_007013 [Aspergillus melleus]KAH8429347.1 hypothetical protein LDX57_007013 [Aspergillus melleus]